MASRPVGSAVLVLTASASTWAPGASGALLSLAATGTAHAYNDPSTFRDIEFTVTTGSDRWALSTAQDRWNLTTAGSDNWHTATGTEHWAVATTADRWAVTTGAQ